MGLAARRTCPASRRAGLRADGPVRSRDPTRRVDVDVARKALWAHTLRQFSGPGRGRPPRPGRRPGPLSGHRARPAPARPVEGGRAVPINGQSGVPTGRWDLRRPPRSAIRVRTVHKGFLLMPVFYAERTRVVMRANRRDEAARRAGDANGRQEGWDFF